MKYLLNLGFDDNTIKIINNNFPKYALFILVQEEEKVTKNINYLKELGYSNYVDAFVKFYNIFLLDLGIFDNIFSKYDREDLIIKLEKNVAIMEYL